MAKAHDDGLGRITEIVRAGADTHSPLYRWMWKHHDRLIELLEATRPDWRRLAEGFAEIGLKGADEQPMTSNAARHTWWRVRRGKAAVADQPTKKGARAMPKESKPTPERDLLAETQSGPAEKLVPARDAKPAKKSVQKTADDDVVGVPSVEDDAGVPPVKRRGRPKKEKQDAAR